MLDLPASDGAPPTLQWIAAFADPWPGPLTVWRAEGDGFVPHATIGARAAIGALLDPLQPGPTGRWDRVRRPRIALGGGTLAGVTEEAALAGANSFAVAKPGGLWEIASAAGAELVGDGVYRLSNLLRGLEGSEEAVGLAALPGAICVRLDGALVPLTSDIATIGQTRRYRVGPAGLDHADPRFVEITTAATARALYPRTPVHLRAAREADGIRLRWIRRGRIGHDSWDLFEIPLGEDIERYELDVLSPTGAVLRTLTADRPEVVYPTALEAADLGGPQARLRLDLAQVSAVAGRGPARRWDVAVG